MKSPRRPLFLARGPYRSRRLADAARLLPVLGAFLVLLPILWQPAATGAHDTALSGLYLFGLWAGLIAAAAFLAGRLMAAPEAAPGQAQADALDDGEDGG